MTQCEIDLEAYLARIAFAGPVRDDLATLADLHLHHVLAIPFENLNPLLGLPVSLELADLQQKLLVNGRGGYCFEQNLLFQAVLERLGFRTRGLAARVLWNAPEQKSVPRTHMLLLVDLGGRQYLADVGFGGLTLTTPLRLEAGQAQSTSHEPFRLLRDQQGCFVLQVLLRDQWASLYRFDLQEQFLPDYEVVNWYVSCHPRSRFASNLVAARTVQGQRYGLLNNALAIHHLDGTQERRTLNTPRQMRVALEELFGIVLPQGSALDQVLRRLASAPPGTGTS